MNRPIHFPHTPAGEFAYIIDSLKQAVGLHARPSMNGWGGWGGGVIPALIARLLITRLFRVVNRFSALVARLEAGIGSRPRPRRAEPARDRAQASVEPSHEPRPAPRRLPSRFSWLRAYAPETSGCRARLEHLFAQPAMKALLMSDPRFGRLLRPLAHTLGMRLAPEVVAAWARKSTVPTQVATEPVAAPTAEADAPAPAAAPRPVPSDPPAPGAVTSLCNQNNQRAPPNHPMTAAATSP